MIRIFAINNESSLAGLTLMLGAIIILITILFEYQIGWIGVDRPASEVPHFIYEAWPQLKIIWGWQTMGFFMLTVAYVLLLKNATNTFKSLLLAILFLCGLSIVIAFGITLGSYYPALKVYESRPEVFDSLRGAVRSLYSIGLLSLAFLGILYLFEIVDSAGIINKCWGFLGLGIVLLGVLLSFVPSLPGKLIGAVIFFLPVFIGYGYWKYQKTTSKILET